MACENDKCEKYGFHHDYKDGVEISKCQFCMRDDHIENNKRKDSDKEYMKCEICGIAYKSYYPDFREIEERCNCSQRKRSRRDLSQKSGQ